MRRKRTAAEASYNVQLECAIRFNQLETLKQLLINDPELINCDINGSKPIHIAAGVGNGELVNYLFEIGCDINAIDLNMRTPLDIACINNRQTVSLDLVEIGAKFTLPKIGLRAPEIGRKLLHWAAKLGRIKAINMLLDKNVNINDRNDTGGTALHLACSFKQIDAIDILAKRGASFSFKEDHGQLPLDKCKDDAMKEMLKSKYFPLHMAIRKKDIPLIEKYINEMTYEQMIITDEVGHTPLLVAIETNDLQLVKLVTSWSKIHNISQEQHLLFINKTNNSKLLTIQTPLSIALSHKNKDCGIVKFLCLQGASVKNSFVNVIDSCIELGLNSNLNGALTIALYASDIYDFDLIKKKSWNFVTQEFADQFLTNRKYLRNWMNRKSFLCFLYGCQLLDKTMMTRTRYTTSTQHDVVSASDHCSSEMGMVQVHDVVSNMSPKYSWRNAIVKVFGNELCVMNIISYL